MKKEKASASNRWPKPYIAPSGKNGFRPQYIAGILSMQGVSVRKLHVSTS
jgi:hypothetical protein